MGHNPCEIEIQLKIGTKAGYNMYLNCAPDIIDFRLNDAKLLGENTIHNNALISRERNDEMA